jgi:hypothetical protein
VASLYGEAGERCPGEPCPRYRSASEPKLDACRTCTICEGRGPTISGRSRDDEVVDHVQRLARERDTFPAMFAARRLKHCEFELLMVWDDARDMQELVHKRKLGVMFEMLLRTTRC